MDSTKRTRPDNKIYNDRRSYSKKIKIGAGAVRANLTANTIIFDNGSYTIKIGNSKDELPSNIPNQIMKAKAERKRVFIADQIDDCRDLSGLYYINPHERGYITKFDVQKNIWDHVFNKHPVDDNTVVMAQPIYNFRSIQEFCDEVFFEDYDIKAMYKANQTDFCYYKYIHDHCHGRDTPCVVIDTGFSFTHLIPYINGKKYNKGMIRLEVGGKILTNYLKDMISYRQLHVMEETHVINQVKEDVCFVAQDFLKALNRAKTTNEIVQNYVLPDFHNIRRGYIQEKLPEAGDAAENCQILRLNNERIIAPEVLMRPSLIPGLDMAGIAECLGHVIERCPARYQKALAENVLLVGGSSKFPGLRQRIEEEGQRFLPCHVTLKVHQPDDPQNYAWLGARKMAHHPRMQSKCVTKQEYEEHGSHYIYDKFNTFCKLKEASPKKEPIVTRDQFSYLEYWKKEGVDLLGKEADQPAAEPNVLFKLEGENIEEYDGKNVVIELEYEKPKEEPRITPPEVASSPQEDGRMIMRRKLRVIPPVASSPISSTSCSSSSSTLLTAIPTRVSAPITSQFVPNNRSLLVKSMSPSTSTSTSPLIIKKPIQRPQILTITPGGGRQYITLPPGASLVPKLTRIQTPMLRPLIRVSSPPAMTQTKMTQFVSLANMSSGGKTVSLVPAGAAGSRVLNNAVIMPQSMLSSKNLTFQIVPIKQAGASGSGNIIFKPAKQ